MGASLVMYTIYLRPRDWPDHVVVRAWETRSGGPVATDDARLFNTVEEAHSYIHTVHPDAVCLQSAGVDLDPHIYEVWA